MTNSSPPQRATKSRGPMMARSRLAISTRSLSPVRCPRLSLTCLKSSRSLWQTMISAYNVGNVADVNTMMSFRNQGTTEKQLQERFEEERKQLARLNLNKDQDQ